MNMFVQQTFVYIFFFIDLMISEFIQIPQFHSGIAHQLI